MIVRRLNLRSSLSTRLTVFSASGQSQNTRRAGWNRRKQFKPFLINNLFPSQASENRVSSWIWRSSRPGWRSSPRHGSYQPTPGMHRNFIFSVTRFLVLGTKDMTSMPSLSVVQKFTIKFSFVAKTTIWGERQNGFAIFGKVGFQWMRWMKMPQPKILHIFPVTVVHICISASKTSPCALSLPPYCECCRRRQSDH